MRPEIIVNSPYIHTYKFYGSNIDDLFFSEHTKKLIFSNLVSYLRILN